MLEQRWRAVKSPEGCLEASPTCPCKLSGSMMRRGAPQDWVVCWHVLCYCFDRASIFCGVVQYSAHSRASLTSQQALCVYKGIAHSQVSWCDAVQCSLEVQLDEPAGRGCRHTCLAAAAGWGVWVPEAQGSGLRRICVLWHGQGADGCPDGGPCRPHWQHAAGQPFCWPQLPLPPLQHVGDTRQPAADYLLDLLASWACLPSGARIKKCGVTRPLTKMPLIRAREPAMANLHDSFAMCAMMCRDTSSCKGCVQAVWGQCHCAQTGTYLA